MGKIKKLEHKQTKFEQHITNVAKKIEKQEKKVHITQQPKKNTTQEIQKKKNLFALDSDDDGVERTDWKLTHKGQDLQEDYNDQEPVSSEDEQLPKGFVKNNHFVGFDQQQQQRKSKKEIYEDIIQNSKQRKMEKQKQKETNQTKLLYLNETLPQILDILPIKQKSTSNLINNDGIDYFSLMQTFQSEPKVQAEVVVQSSEKEQHNYMKQKREEAKRKKIKEDKEQIEKDSDEDDDEIENDDCVSKQFKNAKEKQMLKSYKKVEHMQRVMEHLRNIQNKKKNNKADKQQTQQEEDDDEEDEDNLDEVVSEDYEDESGTGDDDDEDDDDDDDENEDSENGDDDDEEDNDEEDDEEDEDEIKNQVEDDDDQSQSQDSVEQINKVKKNFKKESSVKRVHK